MFAIIDGYWKESQKDFSNEIASIDGELQEDINPAFVFHSFEELEHCMDPDFHPEFVIESFLI